MSFAFALTWISIAVILYHFAGYPILLGAICTLRRQRTPKKGITPAVSMIVAAHNEENVIEEKIRNILEMDYPREQMEVLVVTDGSSDRTPEIVRRYEEKGILLMHEEERRGKGAAINRAVEATTGEILVLSDANALYHPEAIKKLVANFSDSTVGCVSGRKTVIKTGAAVSHGETAYWGYESLIKRMENCLGSTVAVVGEMLALRKTLFRPIPRDIINDDAFLALAVFRQGARVLYEAKATSEELGAQKMSEEDTRRRRMSAGRVQLMLRPKLWPWNRPYVVLGLISHKFLRLLLPVFMLGALAGNLLVVLEDTGFGFMSWLLTLQCTVYGLAFCGFIGERMDRQWKALIPFYFGVRMSLASIPGFWRYWTGRDSVAWERVTRYSHHPEDNKKDTGNARP